LEQTENPTGHIPGKIVRSGAGIIGRAEMLPAAMSHHVRSMF